MSTKKYVLGLLESERGTSLSGESIAGRLGVTRAAVWKAIKQLQKQGYKIEAATNKGYVLCDGNDILSAEGIRPFLTPEGKQTVNIFVYDSLESTNITAKEMAVGGAAHGTVVIAESQTAGRGRYERKFASPAGSGIYMSIILRPSEWPLKTLTLATHHTAVCVCEAIEASTEKLPKVKWVNDVFLDGRKICGISTEAMTDFETGGIAWIVVGIGVNHTMPKDLPDEFKPVVGAVFGGEAPTITRNRLAAEIINRVVLPAVDAESRLIAQYKKRVFVLGQSVVVMDGENPYSAEAVDVDEAGRLVVRKSCGALEALQSGEISIRTRGQ